MRKKIAVVGDKGSVLGFKAVGFEVFMTSHPAGDPRHHAAAVQG